MSLSYAMLTVASFPLAYPVTEDPVDYECVNFSVQSYISPVCICLLFFAGVGKTSIARSIARALNRNVSAIFNMSRFEAKSCFLPAVNLIGSIDFKWLGTIEKSNIVK